MSLSGEQKAILDFERPWWKYQGAKETAVRERFDMSLTRYYQVVNSIIELPEAMAYDPLLVKRLRRMRDARARQRDARQARVRGARGLVAPGAMLLEGLSVPIE